MRAARHCTIGWGGNVLLFQRAQPKILVDHVTKPKPVPRGQCSSGSVRRKRVNKDQNDRTSFVESGDSSTVSNCDRVQHGLHRHAARACFLESCHARELRGVNDRLEDRLALREERREHVRALEAAVAGQRFATGCEAALGRRGHHARVDLMQWAQAVYGRNDRREQFASMHCEACAPYQSPLSKTQKCCIGGCNMRTI